jgi:hypothetical protein
VQHSAKSDCYVPGIVQVVREAAPLIRPLLHDKRGGLIRDGLL